MKTYLIEWHGPFSPEEVDDAIRNSLAFYGNGLYLITGKGSNAEKDSKLKYVGKTSIDYQQRFKNHHALKKIRYPQLWLGNIVSPENITNDDLELAEHILIYFSDYGLVNQMKIKSPPKSSGIVLSTWFKTDGSPRMRRTSPLRNHADVLIWDNDTQTLHFTQKLNVFNPFCAE